MEEFFRLWSNLIHAFSSNYRFHLGIEMHVCIIGYQYQRDSTLADERISLWRLMCGGCNNTPDETFVSIIQLFAHAAQTPSYVLSKELTFKSITYKSASGKSYDFNTADKTQRLLINALLATGQLKSGQEYDFDFDHQFIETEKYDAKPTYKKFFGYRPGVYVIGDKIVISKTATATQMCVFNQKETHKRFFSASGSPEHPCKSLQRMDCGSCSKEIVV